MVAARVRRADGGAERGRGGRVRSNKLWTTRPETGESVLLEDSAGPLSAPAWSRDGTSLAFGRLTRGTETVRFVAGDVLFVPSGMEHRFTSFSADFKAWA